MNRGLPQATAPVLGFRAARPGTAIFPAYILSIPAHAGPDRNAANCCTFTIRRDMRFAGRGRWARDKKRAVCIAARPFCLERPAQPTWIGTYIRFASRWISSATVLSVFFMYAS